MTEIQLPSFNSWQLLKQKISQFKYIIFQVWWKLSCLRNGLLDTHHFSHQYCQYMLLMCQDLSCGTKTVTSGTDDHSLHMKHVNSRYQFQKCKLKLGQNKFSKYPRLLKLEEVETPFYMWGMCGWTSPAPLEVRDVQNWPLGGIHVENGWF